MKKKILLHPPTLGLKEKRYLIKTVSDNWISTAGPNILSFENKIKIYTKSKYCLSMANGTSAIHLALKAVGVEQDDEVIVPTLTFIASINPITYIKANPVFMDSDEYFNIDSKKTIEFLKNHTFMKTGYTYNKNTKKRISAIVPVHVWGNAVYLDKLFIECKKRNIKIVEDASESLGTWYTKGKFSRKHTGTIGDIGCLSFNSNKIITCGGGGAIITGSKKYYEKIKLLASQARIHKINFIHSDVGYNYRITSLHAAIGTGQIESIKKILIKKKKIREIYKKALFSRKIKMNLLPNYSNNNCWMNLVNLELNNFNKIYKKILELSKSKIETRPVWHLNHLQQPFTRFQSYKISVSKKLFENYICLPSGLSLKKKEVESIINHI